MLQNFGELQNELRSADRRVKSGNRRRIFAVLLFVLFFGASLSVRAQEYVVDRTDDSLQTACDNFFNNNDCTLRGAIQRANMDGSPSTIQLAVPMSGIVLTGGTLTIANDQSLLITSDAIVTPSTGGRVRIGGGFAFRVFSVSPGANVTFRNITIANGRFSAANDGAAIDNNGGMVAIDNCFVLDNASTDDAGAVKNTVSATMTINNTEFQANTAPARGGAIFNEGTMTITNSLFRLNSSSASAGGGIYNAGTLTVRNTTVSDNRAATAGGGIYAQSGTLTIENSTISENKADTPNNGVTIGGGVFREGGVVNVGSSIIAGNTNLSSTGKDFGGNLTSLGYNIIGNAAGTNISGQTFGNQLNVDPKLLPFRANGGSLATYGLASNSPAIDKGSLINLPNLTTDNRGFPRRFDFPGITNPNTGVDVGAFERQPSDGNLFDFDGDRKADVSVFRPSNGTWYLLQSTAGFTGLAFGFGTDRIVPGDYDGDGKTDVAVFRPSNGTWYLQRSTSGFTGVAFGQTGDIPLPGDFDGDGKTDICVFRPSNGTWYYLRSSDGSFSGVAFGQSGDVPVGGDFDGDLRADIAVYRPSNGTWYRLNSTNGQFAAVQFGIAEDKTVPGDFDGDGRTDIAVWRPSTGTWYWLLSSTGGFSGLTFGASTDLPVQGDYDGDGRADQVVFRPTNGTWYLNRSTSGFTGVAFGTNGDKPLPNAFVP